MEPRLKKCVGAQSAHTYLFNVSLELFISLRTLPESIPSLRTEEFRTHLVRLNISKPIKYGKQYNCFTRYINKVTHAKCCDHEIQCSDYIVDYFCKEYLDCARADY